MEICEHQLVMNAIKASILILLSLLPTCFIAILVIKSHKWRFAYVANFSLSVAFLSPRRKTKFLMLIDTIRLNSIISKRQYNFIRKKHCLLSENNKLSTDGKIISFSFEMKLISVKLFQARMKKRNFVYDIFARNEDFLILNIFVNCQLFSTSFSPTFLRIFYPVISEI